jgi:hypothetical protein
MEFHLTNTASSQAVTNVLQLATNLMTAVGNATGTPGALATTLANPVIKSMSTQIDTELSNHWTNSNDLKINPTLEPSAGGNSGRDRITFKMPPINASPGGVSVGANWDAGGTIFLRYTGAKFKSGGQWVGADTVMVVPIVPSTTPGSETTLYKIVLNGDAAGGFKLSNLNSATTVASLATACQNLRFFLASFLVPDDALVARYAVLKGSPYDSQPTLRAGSGCFDQGDDQKLMGMRDDYRFSAQPRESLNPRSPGALMGPILVALLSGNPGLIGTVVTTPSSNFYLVLGKNPSDYVQGSAAVARLSQSPLRLTCYQARPSNDLSSIAALATYNGTTTGSLVSFDAKGNLASVVLMSPDDLAAVTGISVKDWLDPSNKWADPKTPQCKSS